jgi:hypothetical protein
MVNFGNEINSVKFIQSVTDGQAGNRVFSIEIFSDTQNIKIIIEKEQLISACEYIIKNLYREKIKKSKNNLNFEYESVFDLELKSNNISINIIKELNQFEIHFKNQEDENINTLVIASISYEQAITFAKSSIDLASKGRPNCKLCYKPMNLSDISSENPQICINCPRKNGHHTR